MRKQSSTVFQNLGVGVGLKRAHFKHALVEKRDLGPDWYELISENFIYFGGRPRNVLLSLRARGIPLVGHGVGLNLASLEPLDRNYVQHLVRWADEIESPYLSDHLCFSGLNRHTYHDLIPVPRTREAVNVVVKKLKSIQKALRRPFAIENISFYLESKQNEMTEAEFITEILDRSGALLLLDVNNIFVNQENLGVPAEKFLDQIPLERVVQIHLAGHWNRGDLIIDTHGSKVIREVWSLYRTALQKLGRPVSTLIEWDNDLPSWSTLCQEVARARKEAKRALQ